MGRNKVRCTGPDECEMVAISGRNIQPLLPGFARDLKEGGRRCVALRIPFTLTLVVALFNVEALQREPERSTQRDHEEIGPVTKKEIVKQISERIGLTQLKTKEIVQQTFDAIVETLLEVGRIELRNFGVFEVKQRKARKARNPRTGDKVDVPPKNVVTFKPGKEMEEKVRKLTHLPNLAAVGDDDEDEVETATAGASNGSDHEEAGRKPAARARSRKAT